jgi:[acyl-carrier-protein] S-malonyltransferase
MVSQLPGRVLVFPGQGAQAIGMGQDLAQAVPAARELFLRADRLLGFPLSRAIFEGPEQDLLDTAIQQPALVLMSLAVLKALETRLGRPPEAAAAAGLSLGEYAALAAVGALEFDDVMRLVRRRGELMKEAAGKVPSGMAAVFQLDAAKVQAACDQAARQTGEVVSPCNYNGGGQIVIGGTDKALALAGQLCKAAGARRVFRLPVAGAFHTRLMDAAAAQLKAELDRAPLARARVPVYANVSAAPVQEPQEIREALARQLTGPVLWEQTVRKLAAAGHGRFLELGCGTTLSNMVRRIAPEARVQALGTWAEVQAFAE